MSKKKFKNLVKKIASGNSQETSLDLKNNDLKDEDLNLLWQAINNPQAAAFRSKLEEIDLGNLGMTAQNRFSEVVIEDLPALKKFSIYRTAPISGGQKLILRKLPALEQIIANNNDIQEFITEDLPNIRKINLKWNMLKDFNAAQFPQLNTLAISNNRMAIVDLSGLPSLKICEIGEEQLANIPTQIRAVYLGNGTTFERLYYNSFHFDPITKNILHKYKRDFNGKYRDTNNAINPNLPDFNLNDFKNYVLEMLNFYRINRAGFDLKKAAMNYMSWLFNPEIKKDTTKKDYRINMSNYDVHLLIINELFIDNLRARIESLYKSLDKDWTPAEIRDLNEFANQQIAKLKHEAISKLANNPVLRSQMSRFAAKFNAKQDMTPTITPSDAIVVAPVIKKPKSILYRTISKQISYIAKKMNYKPFKNKLQE